MISCDFLLNPNLPENKVKHVVVSSQYSEIISALNNIGVQTSCVTQCPDIIKPVSAHADMLFSYLGKGDFVCEKSQQKLKQRLISDGFKFVSFINLKKEYPYDISLNSCIVNKSIICFENNTPDFIKNRFNIINVRQGYAKCSCAVVDENSVITDDESIYSELIKNGYDVLLVSKGAVKLQGFDYGFIGGCCGKLAKDTIAFCGDLRTHSDYYRINGFLRERHVYPLSLMNGDLVDIGSILPISEEKTALHS